MPAPPGEDREKEEPMHDRTLEEQDRQWRRMVRYLNAAESLLRRGMGEKAGRALERFERARIKYMAVQAR